jgi:hemoglobin-like flavoprotein
MIVMLGRPIMTENDGTLIRESFAHLHRRKAETAAMFYDRLFAVAPETRSLFKGDMSAQGAKLMETLTVAIASLRDPQGLVILLKKLGREHKTYGVRDSHYDSVGSALIWTLKTSLGAGFTPQIERAWTELYGEIAGVMIAAARES